MSTWKYLMRHVFSQNFFWELCKESSVETLVETPGSTWAEVWKAHAQLQVYG
jgi:hypothetical protein